MNVTKITIFLKNIPKIVQRGMGSLLSFPKTPGFFQRLELANTGYDT